MRIFRRGWSTAKSSGRFWSAQKQDHRGAKLSGRIVRQTTRRPASSPCILGNPLRGCRPIPPNLKVQGEKRGLDDFSFLAMRYKAQGFPKGGALYRIAEKKREAFPDHNLPRGSLEALFCAAF
jgi:hypothetical protein